MKKIFLLISLFSFFYSWANDSTKTKPQPKDYHFFSFLPTRLIVGEAVVFYEFVNKKNVGTEIGLGYYYPLKNDPYYFLNYNTGNCDMHGFSLWASQKFYGKKHPYFYYAPEIKVSYRQGDAIQTQWRAYSYMHDYASQKRAELTLSGKVGWRTRLGILDFYLGMGVKIRFVETTYTISVPQAGSVGQLKDDNGSYIYLVPRIGIKMGFGLKKKNKSNLSN